MLKPEVSLTVALATGTLVYSIYQGATPTIADIRTVDPNNSDVQSAERQATWTAAAAVAGISLIAKDPNPFIFGGAMVIVMAWGRRHADMVNPLTGLASGAGLNMSDVMPDDSQQAQPADYGYAGDVAAVA